MLNSGPRSYYDEYVRKKGIQKIVQDPTSLLTDRGAYVNFLEVQIERVSAACLTAQAYEDRFNDMQEMIKSLEQRCASNVKLISLAQQCTQEVRSEANHKLDLVIKQQFDDRKIFEKSIHILSQPEQNLERAVSAIPLLDSRLLTLEKALLDHEIKTDKQSENLFQLQQILQKKFDDLEAVSKELSTRQDSFHSRLNQFGFDLEESRQRMTSFQEEVQQRITNELTEFQMKYDHSIKFLEESFSLKVSQLEKNQLTYRNETVTTIKQHYNNLSSELHSFQSEAQEEILAAKTEVLEQLQDSLSSLQQTTSERIEELNQLSSRQVQQIHSLEEELISFYEKTDLVKQEILSKQSEMELRGQHSADIYEQQLSFLQQQLADLRQDLDQVDLQQQRQSLSSRSKSTEAISMRTASRDSSRVSVSSTIPSRSSKKTVASAPSVANSSKSVTAASAGTRMKSRSKSRHEEPEAPDEQMRSLTIDDFDALDDEHSEAKLPSRTVSHSDSEVTTGKRSLLRSASNQNNEDHNQSQRSMVSLLTEASNAGKKLKKTVSYKDDFTLPPTVSFDFSSRDPMDETSKKSTRNNPSTVAPSLPSSTKTVLSSDDILSSLDNYSQQMASYLRDQIKSNNQGDHSIVFILPPHSPCPSNRLEVHREGHRQVQQGPPADLPQVRITPPPHSLSESNVPLFLSLCGRLDKMYNNVLRAADSLRSQSPPRTSSSSLPGQRHVSPKTRTRKSTTSPSRRLSDPSRSPSSSRNSSPSISRPLSTKSSAELQEYLTRYLPYPEALLQRRSEPLWRPTKTFQLPEKNQTAPLSLAEQRARDNSRRYEAQLNSQDIASQTSDWLLNSQPLPDEVVPDNITVTTSHTSESSTTKSRSQAGSSSKK
jgi:hypothetical protein